MVNAIDMLGHEGAGGGLDSFSEGIIQRISVKRVIDESDSH